MLQTCSKSFVGHGKKDNLVMLIYVENYGYSHYFSLSFCMQEMSLSTWRIIPVSKWLVTPIYDPFRPFVRGPTTPVRGPTITMVINHFSNWDDPPSMKQSFISL